ncbi:hypothetical protein [Rhodococcus jostii]|uniref:hypothetical protein n=1 Tax=Rhodococcus jostii TaxID=132919 RepID=UPI003642A986
MGRHCSVPQAEPPSGQAPDCRHLGFDAGAGGCVPRVWFGVPIAWDPDDLVGVLHRREPVRDDDGGLIDIRRDVDESVKVRLDVVVERIVEFRRGGGLH